MTAFIVDRHNWSSSGQRSYIGPHWEITSPEDAITILADQSIPVKMYAGIWNDEDDEDLTIGYIIRTLIDDVMHFRFVPDETAQDAPMTVQNEMKLSYRYLPQVYEQIIRFAQLNSASWW